MPRPTTRPRDPAPSRETSVAVVPFDPAAAGRELKAAVDGRRSQLAALLGLNPDSLDPREAERGRAALERFVTVALHAATSRPDLLRATKESLVEAIRDAAMLGLEPVGINGDGTIVVYDEKVRKERPAPSGSGAMIVYEERVPTAHFQPMYRGLLKVARRSDEIATIDAQVVYEGDLIELESGTNPSVRHVPELDGRKRGNYLGAYAFAVLANGQRHVDYMTTAEIEVSRKQSRSKDAMAWTSFWTEMARKTVLRRLMKRLPSSTLAELALRIDAEADGPVAMVAPVPEGSDARARLRSRFVGPTLTAGADEDGAATPPDGSTGTQTPEDPDPAVSGDPAASEPSDDVVEAVTRPDVCGAESDPKLGDSVRCVLAAGHAHADETPSAHRAENGTVFPNRGSKP